jgi:hypothetical protein
MLDIFNDALRGLDWLEPGRRALCRGDCNAAIFNVVETTVKASPKDFFRNTATFSVRSQVGALPLMS